MSPKPPSSTRMEIDAKDEEEEHQQQQQQQQQQNEEISSNSIGGENFVEIQFPDPSKSTLIEWERIAIRLDSQEKWEPKK